MVPSKIKIESFAKRYHMGTLGGKGLKKFVNCHFLCCEGNVVSLDVVERNLILFQAIKSNGLPSR